MALRLTPQKREFFALFTQASANAREIARTLVELLDSWPDTRGKLLDIRELEHEGDRLTHEAVAELFRSGADPLTIIRWKDIHEQLEEAVDACENAADVLEAILVKNR